MRKKTRDGQQQGSPKRRYKSCRRSTSELFSKEQEQELAQCAQSEILVEQHEPEQEQTVKVPEASPPKLTPLRWRSTSMKELNSGLGVPGSALQAEQSGQIQSVVSNSAQPAQPSQQTHLAQSVEELRRSQSGRRPSQAQLRAQVMNFLSVDQVDNTLPVDRMSASQIVEPMEVGGNSENLAEQVHAGRIVNLPEESMGGMVESPMPEEQVIPPERVDPVLNNHRIGGGAKKSVKPGAAEPVEEIIFQPVDLDQKYREKELVRHVTAAKIQNREEALLNNPGSPGLASRKVPVGEEPAAMTIEFLRARLQAERSASKATKLKMDQLSKKVLELEGRLLAEVELRKSSESSLQDSLLKLKQVEQQVASSPMSDSQKAADVGELKTVLRLDGETNVEVVEPNPLSQGEFPESKLLIKEDKESDHQDGSSRVGVEEQSAVTQDTSDSNVVNEGGLWRDRSVSPNPSAKETLQAVSSDGEGSSTATKVSQDLSSGSSLDRGFSNSKQKQELKAAIEERLRSLWAKIGEDMAALAEVRGEEDHVKKDILGWMDQLPLVLQDKQSRKPGPISNQQVDSSEGHLSTANQQVEAHESSKVKQDGILSKATVTAERHNSLKRNASLAKNVAKLVEQFEFQETAQREWEENFEAQQSLKQHEDDLPPLVTRDGDVLTDSELDPAVMLANGDTEQTHKKGEKNLNSQGGSILRSKSMGLLPSEQGPNSGSISRKASSNGRIEILDDNPTENGGDEEELLFDPETEVAEELPNGIYLHHSRADVDPYRRSPKDAMSRKSTERGGVRDSVNSPSRPERASRSRERYPGTKDSHGEVDHQGWPVREVKDRASRDMYYDPVINHRGGRVDSPYRNSDREFLHRSKTAPERVPDETVYRNGARWEAQGMDPNWVQRQEERRVPTAHYSRASSEEAPGMPYGYRDRDHLEQDVQYRNSYRVRDDGHKGMHCWQEGGDPMRSRGMGQNPYRYPSPYGVEEPRHQGQYGPLGQYGDQPGQYTEAGGYVNRRETQYMPHGGHNSRSDYYPPNGMPGPGPPINGYMTPPGSRGYTGREGVTGHEERNATAGVSEEAPGEASEVLKALRIAKQQIKSSTGEQGAFVTAQYTVSQEHRYGVGGQVSKTSYTVEAPVGYPHVMKTVHEGWHLEGGKSSSKKRGGFVGSNGVAIDIAGANVADLITGAGPLTVTSGESSYVEKLNVGRGIQFFFSG